MLLCLDMGNSQVYGGVFHGDELHCSFRFNSQQSATSDELGVFLRAVLREHGVTKDDITAIAYASVVPERDYSVRSACIKYLDVDPFVLKPGVKTGLNIHYKNPNEVGADRIANAIAVSHMFVSKNILVVDFGTATTMCAISEKKDYLGGLIVAGMRISVEALHQNTAKLPPVAIAKPDQVLGRTTRDSIQSGVYYAQLAAIKDLKDRLSRDLFNHRNVVVIGTGGFAYLFEDEGVFTAIVSDLVLHGLRMAHQLTTEAVRC